MYDIYIGYVKKRSVIKGSSGRVMSAHDEGAKTSRVQNILDIRTEGACRRVFVGEQTLREHCAAKLYAGPSLFNLLNINESTLNESN